MGEMIRIAVCVDDTDDLSKSTSTGAVAEAIAQCVVELGGTIELGVSRHQLLLDERVPYTSHNSSMALTAKLPAAKLGELRERACATVLSMMAATADPGLCVAQLPDEDGDARLYALVAFGFRAKVDYVSKAEAFETASRIPWLTLEELGGDGQGVVGALAGVGLRLSGNDGRFRGRWDLAALCEGRTGVAAGKNRGGGHGRGNGSGGGRGMGGGHGRGDGSGGGCGRGMGHKRGDGSGDSGNGRRSGKGSSGGKAHDGIGENHASSRSRHDGAYDAGVGNRAAANEPSAYRASLVCERLEAHAGGRAMVVDARGEQFPPSTPVLAIPDAKPVLLGGRMAVVSELGADGVARPCSKEELGPIGNGITDSQELCLSFEFDNDREEYGAAEDLRACPNCLFRRWTGAGFLCMKRPAYVKPFSEVIS